MSSESPLIALLEQLESQLSGQRNRIEEHAQNIADKEARLAAAKDVVDQLTLELATEIGAKEAATAEYEQALKIIGSINR